MPLRKIEGEDEYRYSYQCDAEEEPPLAIQPIHVDDVSERVHNVALSKDPIED